MVWYTGAKIGTNEAGKGTFTMAAGTILFADDEPGVRTYIRSILRAEGFRCLEAVDGLDALQKIKHLEAPIDLLLTDVRMPRMDGIALAHSVTEVYPKTPVLFISGFPFDLEEERTKHRSCGFVAKPFTRETLLDAIRKCLRPPEPAAEMGG